MQNPTIHSKPLRLFVTGGTGFLGSHFLNAAQAAGHEVVALRRDGTRTRQALNAEPQWKNGTVASVTTEDFKGCDVLVHLAAAGVNQINTDWESCFQTNVVDSIRLWNKAADAGVGRMIIAGSCFEYGRSGDEYDKISVKAALRPVGAYAASKAAATMAALALASERSLKLIVLRFFHVFGEGEAEYRFWPSLKKAAFAGEDFLMTDGKQIRDFVPVEMAVSKLIQNLERTDVQTGVPIIENVGTGQGRTLFEFADYWWKKWGACGELRPGAIPGRPREIGRYVAG